MLILKYSSSACVCTSADLISLFNICGGQRGGTLSFCVLWQQRGRRTVRYSAFCFSFSVQICLFPSVKLNKASCSLVSADSFFFTCWQRKEATQVKYLNSGP